jgi:hypothetical protein
MKLAHILFATTLAGCTAAAAAQEITLFEGDNFSGRRFAVNGSMPNLDQTGFNDRASSVIVRGGTWQLCSDAYYRGNCVTLQPGNYPTLGAMGLSNRLSSLREIGWNSGGGGGGGGGGGYGARAQLFEGEGFAGRSIVIDQTLPNFDQSGFNDRARSLIVMSGTWQLCSDAHFQGDCRNYGPGRYESLGGTNGQTSSARPVGGGGGHGGGGGNWGGQSRVVLYEGPNFSGRSFAMTTDVLRNFDPAGFNDRASSMRVERGYWMFCTDANFAGECRTFGPGDYPDLPAGMNNRISSGRKVTNDYPYNQPPRW